MNTILIEQIISLEWQMFSQVMNVGGPASCQQDPETFRIMRTSQAQTWPLALLESYLEDIHTAMASGRNLMTEKYAWMMESTFPAEFNQIKNDLPPSDPILNPLFEEIIQINIEWKEKLAARFPQLTGKGRMIRSSEDGPSGTSFETYLRGELKTMSARTITLYHQFILAVVEQKRNLAEEILLNQVRHYGYDSLEAAENSRA